MYNEKNTIEKIIEAVRTAPVQNKEIIVVDDCSNDGTQTLLRDKLSGAVDRIIYHPVNRGKGAALRTGVETVSGDIILIQDADLEYSPEEYPLLLEPIISGKRMPSSAPGSWVGDHIAFFFSGTWLVTGF